MKLIDANLLLLAYDSNATQHAKARQWLEQILSSEERVGIPMLAVSAFLRIGTDRRLTRVTLRMADALAAVESWLELENVELVHTSDATWRRSAELLKTTGMTGAMVTDVHLAALALEHGATLFSNDRDFARFKQVRWVDPLAEKRGAPRSHSSIE